MSVYSLDKNYSLMFSYIGELYQPRIINQDKVYTSEFIPVDLSCIDNLFTLDFDDELSAYVDINLDSKRAEFIKKHFGI